MSFLVDSHCHLDFADFEPERDEIVRRAQANGVGLMVTISTRMRAVPNILALAERYDSVFASAGTHPLNAGEEPDVPTEAIVEASRHGRVVAIGEAGLDFHYDAAPPEVQERVFRRHIEAARETQLPLVIHARDADADMERILVEESRVGAFPFVLHCFSSGARLARVGVELGGTVSFSGILTFRKSDELRAIASEVPLDRLLVETDAPYLAPMPYRGKRNEPAYVRHTAEVLAQVRGVSPEEIARVTSDNFFRQFRKAPDPRPGAASA